MTLTPSRGIASRALLIVLAGGVLGWVLFILAIFSDIAVEAGRTPDELWGSDAVITVRPSTYLFFAAIAVFTLGGLAARRRVAAPSTTTRASLTRGVRLFAATVIIIGLVLAAWGALIVFLSNFQGDTGNESVLDRVLNSYLPIVLYTALVITVILIGFVFTGRSRLLPKEPDLLHRGGMQPEVDAFAQPEVHPDAGPGAAPTEAQQTGGQRHLALAYTIPIIAVAIALIFGLIVYDLTRTSLEVWIWVIVQVCIAVGIIVGTAFAARAIAHQRHAHTPPHGAPAGAVNLNLVLSIIFAATVTAMSLGYGVSAIQQLNVQPSLWLSVYTEMESESGMQPDEVTLNANGSGLARGSEAVVVSEPGGQTLTTEPVDRHGGFWLESALEPGMAPGDYELTLRAETAAADPTSVSLSITVNEDGLIVLPENANAGEEAEVSRLVAPTVAWVFGDLVPAALLLLLAAASLYLTLHIRNPEE